MPKCSFHVLVLGHVQEDGEMVSPWVKHTVRTGTQGSEAPSVSETVLITQGDANPMCHVYDPKDDSSKKYLNGFLSSLPL